MRLQPDISSDKKSHAQRTSLERGALLPKNVTTTTMDKSKCIPCLLTYNRHLSATSDPSFANLSAFGAHPVFATTYSCLHLVLPSNAATSATFLYERNYATLHKNTIPPMLFSMQQPLFYVHRHIKLANFLHIPFHRLRRSITHHIICNSKTLIYRIQCTPCQTIRSRNKATTQRSPQQTTQTRQLTSPPTYQNISSLIITPLMTSQSFH